MALLTYTVEEYIKWKNVELRFFLQLIYELNFMRYFISRHINKYLSLISIWKILYIRQFCFFQMAPWRLRILLKVWKDMLCMYNVPSVTTLNPIRSTLAGPPCRISLVYSALLSWALNLPPQLASKWPLSSESISYEDLK